MGAPSLVRTSSHRRAVLAPLSSSSSSSSSSSCWFLHHSHTVSSPGGHGKEGPLDHLGGTTRLEIVGTPHTAELFLPPVAPPRPPPPLPPAGFCTIPTQ